MQKIADNGYLQPAIVAGLLPTIDCIVQRAGRDIAAKTLKKFLQNTTYPGPDTKAEDFSFTSLVDYLSLYEKKVAKQVSRISAKEDLQNVAIIHRALVTPTGIRLPGPERENKNRVLRTYTPRATMTNSFV